MCLLLPPFLYFQLIAFSLCGYDDNLALDNEFDITMDIAMVRKYTYRDYSMIVTVMVYFAFAVESFGEY